MRVGGRQSIFLFICNLEPVCVSNCAITTHLQTLSAALESLRL